jgi:hypothetical protein
MQIVTLMIFIMLQFCARGCGRFATILTLKNYKNTSIVKLKLIKWQHEILQQRWWIKLWSPFSNVKFISIVNEVRQRKHFPMKIICYTKENIEVSNWKCMFRIISLQYHLHTQHTYLSRCEDYTFTISNINVTFFVWLLGCAE